MTSAPRGGWLQSRDIATVVLGLIALVVGLAGPTSATPDLAVGLEPVSSGFDSPVLLVGAGDDSGDRYVVEQRGRIMRLGADGSVDPDPLLDIVDRVLHSNERGLLGLALHPHYGDNGRFFVAYSRRDDGATSISEFTNTGTRESSEAPTPTVSTERPLLVIAQPYTTHKGGALAFDADGMLIIATGDGGSAWDPQHHAGDPASLLGKLLRIDVDRGWPYATPADNGFADVLGARGEVHALGLRNPWRFSIDQASGDLYIGDVGQESWEEIDVLRRGEREVDFGWSDADGETCRTVSGCDPELDRGPAISYGHEEGEGGSCAVIGGYAYRGTAGSLPQGTYLYADYCSGAIWAVPVEQLIAGGAAPARVGQLDPELGQPQGFGRDDDGELYVVTSSGVVLRISAD